MSNLNNEKLQQLLLKVKKNNNEENMLNFLKEAAVSTYIIPVNGGENISFHAMSGMDNKKYLVVFSDARIYLKKFENNKNQQCTTASFEDLIEAVTSDKLGVDGFIINPGFDEMIFGKEMLKLIKDNMPNNSKNNETNVAQEIPNDENNNLPQMKIGDSERYPVGLRDIVYNFGKENKKVEKIYLRLYQELPDGPKGWLFVFEHQIDDVEEEKVLFTNFKDKIKENVDAMTYIIMNNKNPIAVNATTNAEPVFAKYDE